MYGQVCPMLDMYVIAYLDRRVWKNNSLKLEKIPSMKNYGKTLIRGNYATSSWQKFELQAFLEFDLYLPVSITVQIIIMKYKK